MYVLISGRLLSVRRGRRVDCRVHRAAEEALRTSPYRSVRRVRCHLTDGIAKLEGKVPSFHVKQAAQETVRKVNGVQGVDNRIAVGNVR